MKPKPWVKTSLAPGSQVVTDYLEKAGLQQHLDNIGFNLVGYGCTTCIGNSGPLPEPIAEAVDAGDLVVAAVLSGNRNFEGRINPYVRANYLASPPLVVAYAIAGSMTVDLARDPLGQDSDGKPVYLKDIWPASQEVNATVAKAVSAPMFRKRYGNVFEGPEEWRKVQLISGMTFSWDPGSTYLAHPPYFENMPKEPGPLSDIEGARELALFGDSITTDHISPAGAIKASSPAGQYLLEHGVQPADFNQYGTRRGNHEVMMRGTFANIRIKNAMVKDANGNVKEGGLTIHYPSGNEMAIYDAAMLYEQEGVPLVVFAGIEYGNGSSRDWAAKGTNLLGVRAVVAQSFERIHRSNLVGMGVAPFTFQEGTSWQTLGLRGDERVTIRGLANVKPRALVNLTITRADGSSVEVPVLCRIDTLDEIEYFRNGGILHYVLRNLAA
jgi:aconitate hydratase